MRRMVVDYWLRYLFRPTLALALIVLFSERCFHRYILSFRALPPRYFFSLCFVSPFATRLAAVTWGVVGHVLQLTIIPYDLASFGLLLGQGGQLKHLLAVRVWFCMESRMHSYLCFRLRWAFWVKGQGARVRKRREGQV
jgi:hypothetical protein